ncbi:curli-like amyloid fiber formation chaperone CsgH [Sphingomonas ginkgonis]|nr:curli-like amyloid fiber formation chaperone CsgH [Sphingomonas ginkgonis]
MVEQTGGTARFHVLGTGARDCVASYELEVWSGTGGANRSVQRGQAHLAKGGEPHLLDVALSGAAASRWSAKLHVRTSDGESYDVTRSSS